MQSGSLQASSISCKQGILGYRGDVGHFLFLSIPVTLPFPVFSFPIRPLACSSIYKTPKAIVTLYVQKML